MEELGSAAREALRRPELLSVFHPAPTSPPQSLHPLWDEVASHNSGDCSQTCEDLRVAQAYLRAWGSRPLSEEDENAANYLYDWASGIALPSSVFAEAGDPDDLSDDTKALMRDSRLKSTLAISVLATLVTILPIWKASNASDVISALASFTSGKDPWTSQESLAKSTAALKTFTTETRADQNTFWSLIEQILKRRIKPLFAKTKNPAITAEGRKNFHPIPLPRFDASTLDPETKPWKNHDVYTTTVFAWIISQYSPENRRRIEVHFPLLVPPLLALIDDEGLAFKARGCALLSELLKPIRESKSDILQRTNLSSVFEDAVKPCLLSLPSITPEDDSIRLLGIAYPTLLSLLQTTHQSPSSHEPYTKSITTLLRAHLIPSYHHISTTNPTSASTSTFASFPHARLSTLLLAQITALIHELGIHTSKYLQDLIPLLYSTLTNPFGLAHPPLLAAAVSATRAVVLNAHPRVWRWRAEVLGGVCSCWVRVLEDGDGGRGFGGLMKEMQGVVYLVKVAVGNPGVGNEEPGVVEAKESFEGEVRALVEADERLTELLLFKIDDSDGGYFGAGS